MPAILMRLSTRIYAVVALATVLTAILTKVLLNQAVTNAYQMREIHLSDVVQTSISLLENLAKKVDAGQLELADAQAQANRQLTKLRYGETGYFYSFDEDMNVLSHGAKDTMVGTNQAAFEDINGLKVFVALRDVAVQNGAGLVTYEFSKPGTDIPETKLGYVVHFKPWGWIVGSGSYVSDIQENLGHLRYISSLALAIILIVLVVSSALLVRSVTSPLNALIRRMKGMRKTISIPLCHTPDRVGKLGKWRDPSKCSEKGWLNGRL